MVMLGVISDPASWARFSSEWQECLDMRPPMKALHMTELMSRESIEANERAARFYRIFCNHIKGVVAVSVPLIEYHEIFSRGLPFFKNPYFYVFFLFIRNCRRFCPSIGLQGDIHFTFDEQSGVVGKLAEGWDYYRKNYPDTAALLGDFPLFKDDEKILPLQAADFMAWMFRRTLSDELEGKPKMPIQWNFRDNISYHWAKYDSAMLEADFAIMSGG